MESKFKKDLEAYLIRNGVEEIPKDNKDIFDLLRTIVYNEKINLDIIDLKHNKDRENGIVNTDQDLGNIQNIEINIHNASYYIANIKGIMREERKLKRKAKIKKIFKIKLSR